MLFLFIWYENELVGKLLWDVFNVFFLVEIYFFDWVVFCFLIYYYFLCWDLRESYQSEASSIVYQEQVWCSMQRVLRFDFVPMYLIDD